MEQMGKRMQSQFNALGAGMRVISTMRAADTEAKAAQGGGGDESAAEAAMAKRQKDVLNHVMEAIWNASALDIEATIRKTCDKVLHDFSVSKEVRGRRAKGWRSWGGSSRRSRLRRERGTGCGTWRRRHKAFMGSEGEDGAESD